MANKKIPEHPKYKLTAESQIRALEDLLRRYTFVDTQEYLDKNKMMAFQSFITLDRVLRKACNLPKTRYPSMKAIHRHNLDKFLLSYRDKIMNYRFRMRADQWADVVITYLDKIKEDLVLKRSTL